MSIKHIIMIQRRKPRPFARTRVGVSPYASNLYFLQSNS